jgi:hypothetical protein
MGVIAAGRACFDKTLRQWFFGNDVARGGIPVQVRDNSIAGFLGANATHQTIDASFDTKQVISAFLDGVRCAIGKISDTVWRISSVDGRTIVMQRHEDDPNQGAKTAFFAEGDRAFVRFFGYDIIFVGTITAINSEEDEFVIEVDTGWDISAITDDFVGGNEPAEVIRSGRVNNDDFDGARAYGLDSVSSNYAAVADGIKCIAEGWGSRAVGIGARASGAVAHSCGNETIASGNYSRAEGYQTQATGEYSHADGFGTIASGDGSRAGGRGARATRECQWSRGAHTQASRNQYYFRTSTTNATPAAHAILPNLDDDRIYDCTVEVTALKSDGSACASYRRRLLVKRIGGTVSLVSTVQTIGTDIEDGSGASGWDISLGVNNTTKAITLTITGQASTTIRWYAYIEWSESTLSA